MENGHNNTSDGMELIDLSILLDDMWRGLKRFFWIFLLLISFCSSFFYFRARRAYVPYYQAYSSFVVNTRTAYGYNESYYNKTTAEQLSKTFPYIMTSGVLNQVVAESLGLDSVPATITAEAMEETALFTIKVNSTDPQMAYDVLQAVIENYPTVAEYIIGDTQLTLMDESGVPDTAVNAPNFKGSAKKGALLGAVISLAFLFFYAMTRKTVRREEDIKKRLNITYLGSIPLVKLKKRSKKTNQLVLMDKRECSVALGESFRMIRTRVLKDAEEQNIHRILVTSAAAGEGKTTFAANLAISLSKKGNRVILVDGDLRNPSVASALGLDKASAGIADVLKGKVPLESALISYEKDSGLLVLPGISAVSNPVKFLGSKRMEKLLLTLEANADYVIVDTPPCSVVADASVEARFVQGAVMVVRQDHARIDRIVSGVETMADTGVKILGYAINGTEAGITGYNYGYGYGYGYGRRKYGYGYGYGEKKESERKENGTEE